MSGSYKSHCIYLSVSVASSLHQQRAISSKELAISAAICHHGRQARDLVGYMVATSASFTYYMTAVELGTLAG
jgi:hypothetical protein